LRRNEEGRYPIDGSAAGGRVRTAGRGVSEFPGTGGLPPGGRGWFSVRIEPEGGRRPASVIAHRSRRLPSIPSFWIRPRPALPSGSGAGAVLFFGPASVMRMSHAGRAGPGIRRPPPALGAETRHEDL